MIHYLLNELIEVGCWLQEKQHPDRHFTIIIAATYNLAKRREERHLEALLPTERGKAPILSSFDLDIVWKALFSQPWRLALTDTPQI